MSDPTQSAETDYYSFESLVLKERAFIDGQPEPPAVRTGAADNPPEFFVSRAGLAAEPWVCATSRDCFGLALSGGGIRSATFNLGMLQALDQKRVLERVDYLSTVSGGGYAGGFWTKWCHLHGSDGNPFPQSAEPASERTGSPRDSREPAPIRHLREFSRFLMPRMGLFHIDVWEGIVTILGGFVPSLAAALAMLATAIYFWVVIAWGLSAASPAMGAMVIGALTLCVLLLGDYARFRRTPPDLPSAVPTKPLAVVTAIGVAIIWFRMGTQMRPQPQLIPVFRWLGEKGPVFASLAAKINFVEQGVSGWLKTHFDLWSTDWLLPNWFAPSLQGTFGAAVGGAFAAPAVWLAMVAVLLFVRVLTARMQDPRIGWSAAIDRVIAICLGLTLGWTAVALLWIVCRRLLAPSSIGPAAAGIGTGVATIGGLFVWVRDWLKKPNDATRATTLLKKIQEVLRPQVPQVLAVAAVVLLAAAACLTLQASMVAGIFGWGMIVTGVILGFTLIVFDPARVGMHDFYRSRICRCFLGAAGAKADQPRRDSVEHAEDDLLLGELRVPLRKPSTAERKPCHRPLHLICCTANNLAGDVLGNLYRGGRSAVLSPHGISLGNRSAQLDKQRLSSALTASAAAFNSQMGRISVDFGPAVAFLMSALNLRLGLWVRHPLNPNRRGRFFRGLPFFYEMLGQTNCDPTYIPPYLRPDGTARIKEKQADELGRVEKWKSLVRESSTGLYEVAYEKLDNARDNVERRSHDLHLSDGGHFENLALYELIRRHCRYIIVSDCGADPEVAFDDLANALRTVREDFGVEIDLDVSPLRPDEHGRARQHAVIGTIHYDGLPGLDKGTLLYFKPALTGDEPPDVLQYQTRNPAFPHESTADQFYDEAQWESYRRLGQHAGSVVLRFLDNYPPDRADKPRFVENIFLDAGRNWHPVPERQSEMFLALTQRCIDLESDIRDNAPAALRAEFFPEVAAALPSLPEARSPNGTAGTTRDDEIRTLYFLMLAMQVMEDTWVGAELDTYWSHPLNDGWMNYFQRWASTPSFRRWWPILRPIYGLGFRDFVRDRFDLAYADPDATSRAGARLTLAETTQQRGLAWDDWRRRGGASEEASRGRKILEFRLELDGGRGVNPVAFPIGILLYSESPEQKTVEWRSDDLFVPRSLNGAGIISRFLDSAIARLNASFDREFSVIFDPNKRRPDPASRLQLLHEINFYKSRGFVHKQPDGSADPMRLVLPRPLSTVQSGPTTKT